MIKLYDTAQQSKVLLVPRKENHIGIYVCGPTVYDNCHVGHARCYVAFDAIVRHLRYRGYKVTYVRNITDVDDKIIKRAKELNEDPIHLAQRFTERFRENMDRLANQPPEVEPRVSEHIGDVIQLVQKLIDRQVAYVDSGDVFFSVNHFPSYGMVSHRNICELQAGARVNVDHRKRNPLDFALWKSSKPDEPHWDSPWGPGRPGWHIECSAMSTRYLGDQFDLHGGGMDLIFPHHENENAQFQAVAGPESFTRHWLHNGFINLRTTGDQEEKMSKSLGNVITIEEVFRHHDPEALRLYLLSTHYRNPISFEVEASSNGAAVRYRNLEENERRLCYTYTTLDRIDQTLANTAPPEEGEVLAPADQFVVKFDKAMDDDFNSAAALGLCSDLLTLANRLFDQPKSAPLDVRLRTLHKIRQAFYHTKERLGVFHQPPSTFMKARRDLLCTKRHIDPNWVENQIMERTAARKQKDFSRADEIRQKLRQLGVELMDCPSGTQWEVKE